MKFPIPNRQAETAAKDLASDIRKMGEEAHKLHVAISVGEASTADKTNYETLTAQMKNMADIVFICTETSAEYRVGDYVTAKLHKQAEMKKRAVAEAYERVFKDLRTLH